MQRARFPVNERGRFTDIEVTSLTARLHAGSRPYRRLRLSEKHGAISQSFQDKLRRNFAAGCKK